MRIKHFLLLLLITGLTSGGIYAQERVISGVILDEMDQGPLVGANIVLKGTTIGTITDAEGKYSLKVPGNIASEVLVVSYIGYKKKEVPIDNRTQINVSLSMDVQELGEVVVTSFGIEQEKKSINYAVQELESKELVEGRQENLVNALQGKIAGVQITSASGAPGASSEILIRGATSLSGNNQPLFVVDGIPIDNSAVEGGGNRAMDINPNDIESLTVLKGPAAAALYGLDAANGAIIITTKKGAAGRVKVDVSSSLSIDKAMRFPEQQGMYSRGTQGLSDLESRYSWGPMFRRDEKVYDNLGDFFRTGVSHKEDISISGGSEKATFYLSASNFDQKGIIPETDYNRTSILLKGSAQLSEKLQVGASANYIMTKNKRGLSGDSGGWLLNLMSWPRDDNMSVYENPDGTKRWLIPSLGTNQSDNPLWTAHNNPVDDNVDRILANAFISYDPFDWMNITYRIGRDRYSQYYSRLVSPNTGGTPDGAMRELERQRQITTSTFNISMDKKIGENFRVSLLMGNNVQEDKGRSLTTSGSGFINPSLFSINNMETVRAEQYKSLRRVVGVYGDLKIDYKGMAYINFTGRNDWSSTLPKNNNSFFYPSVSAGVIFSEFIGGDKYFFSFGKLRASYAEVGADTGPYKLSPVLDRSYRKGGKFKNYHTAGNPNLKPETTISKEIGAELKFFHGRLGVDFSLYDTESRDMIITTRITPASGYIIQTFNSGTIVNKGVELMLTGQPLKGDFNWTIDANISRNTSELKELPSFVSEFPQTYAQLTGTGRGSSLIGEPVLGVVGAAYKRTEEGRMVIGEDGYPVIDDEKQFIADRTPDWIIGLTNTVEYKNFTLSMLWDFRIGGDVWNVTKNRLVSYGLSKETERRNTGIVFDGVVEVEEGVYEENTKEVVLTESFYRYNYGAVDENFIEDGSWARLRFLSLGYRLPQNLVSRWGMSDFSINITGRNLLLFTPYSGSDPETSSVGASIGGSGTAGLDYGNVPSTRGLTIGFKASF
ncbi:SusC/RagA family TonB-linked outer membrane protein [Rapidithrix thailandica]|uniref:SusC/RagA family TonB-linked outer membrane protein n=1 Tax=Rapidithrix thailandica TaxID=413964 RepID=A0AAW9SIZ1_9BACT